MWRYVGGDGRVPTSSAMVPAAQEERAVLQGSTRRRCDSARAVSSRRWAAILVSGVIPRLSLH